MTTKDLGMVTAYAYAVMGGYEGTEAEFEALLGNIATDLEEIENLTVIANTLPEGSSATASYADGVLTLGIPKGDTGATGAGATAAVGTTTTGNPGTNASVTNSGTAKDAVFNFTIPRGDTGNGIESIYLTGTSGAVKTYTILFTDGNTTTFDVTDGEVTNASLATILEDYARTDGAYEQMTVGNAEQLISSVTVNDKVPYNFRTSGGSIDIGNREVDKIVGGTVAWNQLANPSEYEADKTSDGVSFAKQSDGSVTVTVTSSPSSPQRFKLASQGTFQSGHKYFLDFAPNYGAGKLNVMVATSNFSSIAVGADNLYSTIWNGDSLASNYIFAINVRAGCPTGTYKVYPKIVDLTQMFGSAIADYVCSLEQATEGAGVAWFKKLFPKPYYAYNAGQLMSVKASAHQMVGFNAWDEQWEVGRVNYNTGNLVTDGNNIRSKNYIKVLPQMTYYIKVPLIGTSNLTVVICGYDSNKNYVAGIKYSGGNTTLTISNNSIRYIKFCTMATNGQNYGNTYHNDICINLSWDGERDGEYEAYKKWTYPLDSDLELRGIPKLDASNNLYYDGDTYEDDGTVTRKYGIVDLGTLSWDATSAYGNVYRAGASLSDAINDNPTRGFKAPMILSSTALNHSLYVADAAENATSGMIGIRYNSVYVTFDAVKTATEVTSALNGVYMLYELKTPTTEEADPYQNPQIVDDFGTEEYVDERTVAIPVGHDTEYMNNLKAKLEMAPDSPDGDGDYIVRQTNGENSYVPLMKELPSLPSTDGTYTLKCTVASGVATLGWESEE